jgi:hypothetical protein
MFDWFKSRQERKSEYNNVVPFPEPREYTKIPYVAPSEPTSEPKTYYTFGLTDDNRVSFTMGFTVLTMNAPGIDQLITQLEFYKSQLTDVDSN